MMGSFPTPLLNVQSRKSILQLILEKSLSCVLILLGMLLMWSIAKGVNKRIYIYLFAVPHKLNVKLTGTKENTKRIHKSDFIFDEFSVQGQLVDQFIQETSALQNDKKKFIEYSAGIKITHLKDRALNSNRQFVKKNVPEFVNDGMHPNKNTN
jgi:hypothetical protein